MAINTIGGTVASASTTWYQPIEAAGTYTMSDTLKAGVYAVSGDTSQTLTFYIQNAMGYKFPLELRGGKGRVYVPVDSTQIIAPAGTYPITLGFEKMSITQVAAPAATWAWEASSEQYAKGRFTVSLPANATQTRVYWEDGTNEYITSGALITPKSFVLTSGVVRNPLITHKSAIGVESLGQVLPTGNSTAVFNLATITASGSWTVPTGATSASVLIVAGGGGGGNGGNSVSAGGGGGAGGVKLQTGVSLTPGQAITATIGAGGGSNSDGGASIFGAYSAVGGGGGRYQSNGNAGGSGGGSGGYSQAWTGGAGTAGQGNAGGSSSGTSAGGGGGYSAAGASMSNNGGGAGGAGYSLASFFSTLSGYVGGGGGGGYAFGASGAYGAGGTGGGGAGAPSGGTPTAGTANTGGGGGGHREGSSGGAGANGGSGVIYVKYAL